MFHSRIACVPKTLAIFAIALLWSGYSYSIMAQGPDYDPRIAASYSPNPKVNHPVRVNNRTGKPSLVEVKRQAIENAIDAGNKARDSSEFELALSNYRKVTDELNPKDPRAFYGLGNVYSDLACSDNAIRAYNDALKLKKDFREAIIALANEYVNKNRLDEAEAQFRSLLDLNAKDLDGSIGLAFVLGKRKQYQEAIAKLNLITANPLIADTEQAKAHWVLGNIYIDQKKYPEAIAELKEVIKLKQFPALAYIRLAQATLFQATSQFGSLTQQEVRLEDREKLISAGKFATENIRKAIYEHNYKHPYGYLFLGYASMYQFSYQEAENNLKTYLTKVKEIEKRLPLLATNCDYGFNQLYAFGYLALALTYNQQSLFETDPHKQAEYHDKVIENTRELIKLKETDSKAYTLMGQVYVAKRQWPEAIEQLEKSITYEANAESKASVYELIALCYSSLQREKEAVAAFNKAREIRPNSTASLWGMARVYQKQGDFDEAIRLMKEALSREQPTASAYWMLASTYFAKARKKNTEADFEEAIKLLEKAIETNQAFGPAYFLLGQVYKFYKDGVYAEKAIENYEIAAKYNPKDATIPFHLGDLYYSVKKNYDAAIKYLRDAINLNPNYAGAYWELGAVYHDSGDEAQAIKYFLEAIRSDRHYQDAYFSLSTIYRDQKKYAEALDLLHKLIEIDPKDYWAYKEMAKIYEAQQKNDEAIKYYQQAIGFLKAEDALWKDIYTCRIERLRRNYAEAIRCFQTLKPSNSEASGVQAYDLGLAYVASGNKKAALEQYEQLKKVGSALAAELMGQINEMK